MTHQSFNLKISGLTLALVLGLAGCSSNSNSPDIAHTPLTPGQPVQCALPADQCQKPGLIDVGSGAAIHQERINDVLMVEVEGIISDAAFEAMAVEHATAGKLPAEREEILNLELKRLANEMNGSAGALILSTRPQVGYFKALLPIVQNELLGALKSIHLSREVLVSPVIYDLRSIRESKESTPEAEGLVRRPVVGGDMSDFSGLKSIHANEFLKLMAKSYGIKPDGSRVRLGITDTGITYHHPTFTTEDGTASRVTYMKDFTGEGSVYINSAARFEAVATGEDEVTVQAQVLETPKKPALPIADKFAEIKNLKLKVSPELKTLLTTAGAKVRLGMILEDSFQAEAEAVDINANGKLTDKLYVLFVDSENVKERAVYFDASGSGDFRKSTRLHEFNELKETTPVYSERIGFSFQNAKLPLADGKTTAAVLRISLVGFDPGNHGTHVAGIAAGRRTISNDNPNTLARGVAPNAQILMNRVCANNGGCNATEAIIDLAEQGGVDVINMSLGGLSPMNDGAGVQETVVNRLTAQRNVLFMISAGNSGPGLQTVGSPSVARLSMSVGATASRAMIQAQYQWEGTGASDPSNPANDFMLFFSSRGPTSSGGFKPMISAPGTELSSVQLNAAPGAHSGLDVYWGTSMAAPTATGAYALLLDAVRLYNQTNKVQLTTNALVLRNVLVESARPFDVTRTNARTGLSTKGQYTWTDQGTGMIDLVAAWKKLIQLSLENVAPPVVKKDGTPVELDYAVITSGKMPNGLAYDGTRAGGDGNPAFGSGLYLLSTDGDTLLPVHIARRLPFGTESSEEGGELARQLVTTAETFRFETDVYGSDKIWLVPGVMDSLPCKPGSAQDTTIIGRGAEVSKNADGTGALVPSNASTINICLNREMIAKLSSGDHGALIRAYRVGAKGVVNAVPSFVIPVQLTVPHKTLAGSTAYDIKGEVQSFGVNRNYVQVPVGTSAVRVKLEVPALKAGETSCAGVELMSLEGDNVSKSFKTRPEARISNCKATGAASEARSLTIVRSNPKPGLWNLNIFGQYKYANSPFTLRVDYVTTQPSISKIAGGVDALTGAVDFKILESSIEVASDPAKSRMELTGLESRINAVVEHEKALFLASPLGLMRKYPKDVKSVTIATGGSAGNDLDLAVLECAATATSPEDGSCKPSVSSGGATDVESVTFEPAVDKTYVVRIDGFDIKNEGKFLQTETLSIAATERVPLTVTTVGKSLRAEYAMAADAIAASPLLQSAYAKVHGYLVVGHLTIETSDGLVIGSLPVEITVAAPAAAVVVVK